MKATGTILVVDDEEAFRDNIAEHLISRSFGVHVASSGDAALDLARKNVIDVALIDMCLPGMDGLELLGRLLELDATLPVLIVTGQGSVDAGVEAMRQGAQSYLTKPLRISELDVALLRALEKSTLARRNLLYREELRRRQAHYQFGIVAHSPAMARVLMQAERMAETDASVLINGETGTGKEVLAEFIHRKSPRAEQPLVVLNCGALSETLLDAELFGHEKGAFTGADHARPGLVETADGGSLLLDEIGDIPALAQTRLLRMLERGLIKRIGSTQERSVDVRIIAATHRNLELEVKEGRFREDLFHRLMVFRLSLPPLRERREDILPLAEKFLAMKNRSASQPKCLTESAQAALLSHAWCGNVREMAHTIERAFFNAELDGIQGIGPAHLGLQPSSAVTPTNDCLISLSEMEKRHIQAVLDHHGGNREKAAKVLGVSTRHLYRLIARHESDANGSSSATIPPG